MMGFEGFSECELSIHSRLASIAGGQNVMKGEVWRGMYSPPHRECNREWTFLACILQST